MAPATGPFAVAGGFDIIQLDTGPYHTCGLDRNGSVLCWGFNDEGQLGNGRMAYDTATFLLTEGRKSEVRGAGG